MSTSCLSTSRSRKELVKNKVKDKKRRRNPDGSFVRDENDGSGNSDEEDEEFIDRFGGSNNFFGPGKLQQVQGT